MPNLEILQPEVIGAFELELVVVGYPGRMALPLVGMPKVPGESAPVASRQRDGGFIAVRAVVVP